jgi:hypothetical protein
MNAAKLKRLKRHAFDDRYLKDGMLFPTYRNGLRDPQSIKYVPTTKKVTPNA